MATASSYQFMSGASALFSAEPTNWTGTPTSTSQSGTANADLMRDAAGGVALSGAAGDDSFYIGDVKTTVVEAGGQGHDTVYSFVSYRAGANIENVTLMSSGTTVTGNDLGNLITAKAAGGTLSGGAGDDVLVDASAGATTFAFAAGSGRDVVYGFTPGAGAASDIIRLEGFGIDSFSQLQGKLSQVGADTFINLNGSDQILLKGVSTASLSAGDFAFNPMKSGVYIGNDPPALAAYETWLGDEADIIGLHTGRASWADWQGSLDWLIGRFKDVDATHAWTLPMFPLGGSLSSGAAGAYDSYYVKAAQSLAAAYPTGDILVRTGVEFNGDWMPWKAQGQEANFAETFRNFVEAFRSVSPRFKFEWNMNIGTWNVDVEKAYPGDAYVDFIGMDFYYDTQWYPADPVAAWNRMLTEPYGLQWFENFAAAHNKPTAYSEWGVNSDTAGPFIEKAAQWFASHNVAYQMYWDSNAAFAGQMDNGQYPNASTTYKALFGGTGPTGYALDPSQVPAAPGTTPPPQTDPNTLNSDVSAVLPDGVKTLNLTGTADISGKGNSLANVINGNMGANLLEGAAGDDTLNGGAGNDTLAGNNGYDRVAGGAGDDVYRLEGTGDTVVEQAGEGFDAIYVPVSFTLGSNIEKLVLEGTSGISGTGNALANTIIGNTAANTLKGMDGDDSLSGWLGNDVLEGGAGDDTLDGGAGGDNMKGGAGNDIYYVDSSADRVSESSGQGLDTIITGSTYTLGSNVENLVFIWDGANWGYGNSLNNGMTGNSGGNYLDGRDGADTLVGAGGADTLVGGNGADLLNGGEGADTFLFARRSGADVIQDFGAGDRIDISAYKSAGVRVTLTAVGEDTKIALGSSDTITLIGVQPGQLIATAAGFTL